MAMTIAHRAGRPASTTAAGGRHQARYHGCTAGPSTPSDEQGAGQPGQAELRACATAARRRWRRDAARNRSRTPVTTGPRPQRLLQHPRHDQPERRRHRQQRGDVGAGRQPAEPPPAHAGQHRRGGDHGERDGAGDDGAGQPRRPALRPGLVLARPDPADVDRRRAGPAPSPPRPRPHERHAGHPRARGPIGWCRAASPTASSPTISASLWGPPTSCTMVSGPGHGQHQGVDRIAPARRGPAPRPPRRSAPRRRRPRAATG